jgi:hypothetical protein
MHKNVQPTKPMRFNILGGDTDIPVCDRLRPHSTPQAGMPVSRLAAQLGLQLRANRGAAGVIQTKVHLRVEGFERKRRVAEKFKRELGTQAPPLDNYFPRNPISLQRSASISVTLIGFTY